MSSLNKKAFGGLLMLFLVMAFLLFAVAGTLAYWQGGRSSPCILHPRSRLPSI